MTLSPVVGCEQAQVWVAREVPHPVGLAGLHGSFRMRRSCRNNGVAYDVVWPSTGAVDRPAYLVEAVLAVVPHCRQATHASAYPLDIAHALYSLTSCLRKRRHARRILRTMYLLLLIGRKEVTGVRIRTPLRESWYLIFCSYLHDIRHTPTTSSLPTTVTSLPPTINGTGDRLRFPLFSEGKTSNSVKENCWERGVENCIYCADYSNFGPPRYRLGFLQPPPLSTIFLYYLVY